MEGRKDQVSGLGSRQRDFDRFSIAHLAYQNHLGRLPER